MDKIAKNTLIIISLILTGCAGVYGPISGKAYYSKDNQEYQEELLEFNRSEYISGHPRLPDEIKNCIQEGKIKPGMTKEEVKASWGKPYEVYRTVSGSLVNEQWIYKIPNKYYNSDEITYYLNFDGEILRSWQ